MKANKLSVKNKIIKDFNCTFIVCQWRCQGSCKYLRYQKYHSLAVNYCCKALHPRRFQRYCLN